MERKTIGSFIAVLRKSCGMTQKELAEKLGVSDKTISHWERDESAPDISLIPIIAEIFSVTCDELLRGERNPQYSEAKTYYSENDLTAKGEKQIKFLFEKALGKLKMKSVICIGVTAVGFVVGLIVTYLVGMKLGSETEYTGLLCASVFYIISLMLTGIFHFQFSQSVRSEDFDAELFDSYRKRANMFSFLTVSLTALVFCYTLPLCSRYLLFSEQFINGTLYAAIAAAVLLIILALLKRSGAIASKPRTKKEKKLFTLRVVTAVVIAAVLAGAGAWEISIINRPVSITQQEELSYSDVDDFIELITTPLPVPYYADEETRIEVQEKMSQEEAHCVTVNGEEYRFEWKNGEVKDFYQTDDYGDGLPIEVILVSDSQAAVQEGAIQDRVYIAGLFFYPAVILIAVLVYVLVSRKIRRSK